MLVDSQGINSFHFLLFPLKDELIREVQIGCYCSFVLLPSCEIHSSSLQLHCTPVFEVHLLMILTTILLHSFAIKNSLTLCYVLMFLA